MKTSGNDSYRWNLPLIQTYNSRFGAILFFAFNQLLPEWWCRSARVGHKRDGWRNCGQHTSNSWLPVWHQLSLESHHWLSLRHPTPQRLSYTRWASNNLSMYVEWPISVIELGLVLMRTWCRTPLQKTKWSSSQSLGALTAKESKAFSMTNSRILCPMLSSRIKRWLPWYLYWPSTSD